jgi:hypothetical protein
MEWIGKNKIEQPGHLTSFINARFRNAFMLLFLLYKVSFKTCKYSYSLYG